MPPAAPSSGPLHALCQTVLSHAGGALSKDVTLLFFVIATAIVARRWGAERSARREAEAALRKAEAELQVFSRDLEWQIRERTEDLQQSVDSLQLVLYHLAHDLRAPLRAMCSFATLLNEKDCGQLTDAGRQYTERIAIAALTLDKLIRDLLDFGRLGEEPLHCEMVACEDILCAVLCALKEEIHLSSACVQHESKLPHAFANPRLLQNTLYQLISNALKFSKPDQPPHIRISAETNANTVTVLVQDHGVGIDPRYHEKIFGLFEKLPAELLSPGTGMGLALARKAVERMGGQIGVKSTPGKGSLFWVRLPRRDLPEGPPDRSL